MAEFVLRPKAIADLDDIWDYTVKTWGSEQAERYLRSINESFRNIADNPDLGRSCDGIREGYRKRGVGRHVIFYRTPVRLRPRIRGRYDGTFFALRSVPSGPQGGAH